MLHGRAMERSVVDRLLAGARDARSGALIVRGEPGIGKTALLDYAVTAAAAGRLPGSTARLGGGPAGAAAPGHAATVAAAPGVTARPGQVFAVIRGAGVESEAELPFAGLHMLLRPALDRRRSLPQPQREALEAAFGLRQAGSYDRFLIGLAVLSLLAELAEDGPVLCLVDDTHWLDRASAEALIFAARRLGAEGIAIIFAARDRELPVAAAGLRELRLSGLDEASAAAVLMQHGGTRLAAEARARILAEACGNPLGLIELPAAYAGEPPPAARLGPLPLTDRLRRAFHGQVRRLPEATQTLLLTAAAEGSDDLGAVLAAGRALGAAVADMAPAEQAGLVHIAGGTVSFRHPLVRAAVYHGALLGRRLAAHRALADALQSPADADRRAWHLAAAATEPDEKVAAELEKTAAKAMARSGYAAAAAAYERAVQLTADPVARAGRLALAAQGAVEIGDFDRARGLAVRAMGQAADPAAYAKMARVAALADFAQGRLPTAHRLLAGGAARAGQHDQETAVRMLMNAVQIAWFLGDQVLMADTARRLQTVGAAGARPLAPLVQLALCSTAQAQESPPGTLPPLAATVAAARHSRAGHRDDLAVIASVCLVTGRNSDARDLTMELVADARLAGRIGALPSLLTCLAQALVFDGRHFEALAAASEALQIAQDTGHTHWTIEANEIMAYLAAVAGDEERCRSLLHAAHTEPGAHVNPAGTSWAPWALGLLDLGCGRLDTALVHLEKIQQGPMRYHGSALRSIPDLVEATVRLGRPHRAAGPISGLCEWARRAGTPSTDALVQRCLALVARDDPERHYLDALKLHETSFEQARTQLLYGAWLRRARRKADARTQLRAAVDYLDRIHAAPWAALARAELSATGAPTPQPSRAGLPLLTPQELQVARLAAQGLSNRDIAAQLFLSPRTVGYHLYKAFPKLGVASRNELDPQILAS
jgi:DNA-binding CsgD family transcriptional regulator